jgi:hypothetical protein
MARRKNEGAKRPDPRALQTGGTRGSSNQGGPERAGEPEKDSALKLNHREDVGSRSSLGRDDGRAAGESARDDDPIRGALPEGTQREDYVGGRRPHKTRRAGPTRGASGGRNEVI